MLQLFFGKSNISMITSAYTYNCICATFTNFDGRLISRVLDALGAFFASSQFSHLRPITDFSQVRIV